MSYNSPANQDRDPDLMSLFDDPTFMDPFEVDPSLCSGSESCRVYRELRSLDVPTAAIIELDREHRVFHSRLAIAKLKSFALMSFMTALAIWTLYYPAAE